MSAWVPEHDKQQSKASAKITDASNTSKLGLKSHQVAQDLANLIPTLTTSMQAPTMTGTSSCPATTLTVTISLSTTAKQKQPASSLEVEDDNDSHILPKGLFSSHTVKCSLWV